MPSSDNTTALAENKVLILYTFCLLYTSDAADD